MEAYIRLYHGMYFANDLMQLCARYCQEDDILLTCIESLTAGNTIPEDDVTYLCSKLKDILTEQSNIVRINLYHNETIIVVGDIRAQFNDLKCCIFDKYGYPNSSKSSPKYIFLGNYISKGEYHTSTLFLLLSLKAKYPSNIILLRGHHESRQMSSVYGLYDDLMNIYCTPHIWQNISQIFDHLPLCSVVNDTVLCVHGGLSPSIMTLDQIELLNRFQEIPMDGPLSDLLWSLPADDNDSNEWGISPKGAGYIFNHAVVNKFCETNNISTIIRASELVMNGYQYRFSNKLLTICSAPNFAYRCGNRGAVAIIDSATNIEVETFDAVPDEKRIDNKLVKRKVDGIWWC
eukprot:399674_1